MRLPKKIGVIYALCLFVCISLVALGGCKDKDKNAHSEDPVSAEQSIEASNESADSTSGENEESSDSENSSENLEEHTHVWVETQNSIAATCEEDGVLQYECECGETKSEKANALGHKILSVAEKAATCTQNGWKAYEACERCEYTTYEESPAAHHWAYVGMLKEPTCIEQGILLFLCENCGQGKYEMNAAFGHDLRPYAAKPAACGEEGWAAYEACARCSYTTKVTVAALEHVWNEGEIVKGATCTTDGVKEYTCALSNCGEKKTEVLSAAGHTLTYSAGRTATCEEDGYNAYEECEVCGYTTKVVTPSFGHSEEKIEAVAATCETDGETEGKRCARCGKITVEPVPVPALGHKEVSVDGKAATCEEDGYKAYTACERCAWNTKEIVLAAGHTAEKLSAVERTCETDGLEEGSRCSVCEKILQKQEILPALGHKERLRGEKEATCYEDGWTGEIYCSVCEKVLQESQPILSSGHTMVVDTRVEPTCTTDGKEYGIHCSACGEILLEQSPIPAAHVWDNGAFSEGQSCEEGGKIVFTCKICREERLEEVAAKAHSWNDGEVTRQATCAQEGEKTFTCFCGSTETEPIEKIAHKEKAVEGKPATCTESGYSAGVVCSVCGEVLKSSQTITPLQHTMKTVEGQVATCETDGWTAGETCARCGETTVRTLTATGHTFVGGVCENCGKQQNEGAVYELSADGTYYICIGRASTAVKELVVLDEYNGKPVKEIDVKDTLLCCGDINSVTIGKNVEKINEFAFYQCFNLLEVYNYSSLNIQKGSTEHGFVAQYAKDVYTTATESKIKVDENGFVTYTNETTVILIGYRGDKTDLALPQTITAIGRSFFKTCRGLKRVVLPDSVTTLQGFTFEDCVTLEEVVIGKGLKKIQINAFKNTPALRSVIFTEGATWVASNGSTTVALKAEILADASVAADALSEQYIQYEWTRS